MELIDFLFPGIFFKVLHEQYTGMATLHKAVKECFINAFYDNKLDLYSVEEKQELFIIIKSKDHKNYKQYVYIGFYGKFLDVFHFVRFDESFFKRTAEMKLDGEMTESEMIDRMGLLSWIDATRKCLEQAIKEVKDQ